MSDEPIQDKDVYHCEESGTELGIDPDVVCDCEDLATHPEVQNFLRWLSSEACEQPYIKNITTVEIMYSALLDIVMKKIVDNAARPSDAILGLGQDDDVTDFLMQEYNRRTGA